jgi:ketosteroid isomerase-like protein
MSRENLDVVRGIYDAVARRDVLTPFEVYAEDIVWDVSNWRRAALDPKQVYLGHEGVREAWRETLDAWGEVDFDVEELTDAGDQVLAVIHEREVGRASGVPVEGTHVAVWTLADGKITQLQVFDDRDAAERAAGLRAVDRQAEELLRALADAWAQAGREAFLAVMHPDAEMWLPRSALEGGAPYRGLEGAAKAWADGFDIWERFEIERRELRTVGDVLIDLVHVRCFPRGEGPPVEYDGYYVTEIRDGKVAYWRPYLDRAEALDAAEARAVRGVRPD